MKRKGDPVVECIAAALEGLPLDDYRALVAMSVKNRAIIIRRKHDISDARRIAHALRRAGHLRTTGGQDGNR